MRWSRGSTMSFSSQRSSERRAAARPKSAKRREARSTSAVTPNFWAKRRSSPSAAGRSFRSTKWVLMRRSAKNRSAARVSALFLTPKIWTSIATQASVLRASRYEPPPPPRLRRRALLNGRRRDQVVPVRRLADRGVPRSGGGRDNPVADPRSAPRLVVARSGGGARLRGRRDLLCAGQQADDRRQHGVPASDEPAVHPAARAVDTARAAFPRRSSLYGGCGERVGAALLRRAPSFRDRTGPAARQHPRGRQRGVLGVDGDRVPLDRAGRAGCTRGGGERRRHRELRGVRAGTAFRAAARRGARR